MGVGKTDLDKLKNYSPGGGGRNIWFRPRPGPGGKTINYKVRILPPNEGMDLPFYDEQVHYLGDFGDREAPRGVCPDSNQDTSTCPACDYYWTLREVLDDEDLKKALQVVGPNTRTYVNLIDRQDEEAGPKAWSMPYGVASDVTAQFNTYAEEELDLSDPKEGRDIVIPCKKQGKSFGFGAPAVTPRSRPIGVEGWESGMHDLVALAHQRVLTVEQIRDYLPKAFGEFWETINSIYLATKAEAGSKPSAAAMPDLEEMSYKQLQAMAKRLELPATGKADEIRERIQAAS